MTEADIKQLIEAHIENIFKEIWQPIENKIRAQTEDVNKALEFIIKTSDVNEKKYRKLRVEFRALREAIQLKCEDSYQKIEEIKKDGLNLKKETLDQVKDSIKEAVALGKKAGDMQLPNIKEIENFNLQIKSIASTGVARLNNFLHKSLGDIKNHADLRILEILHLEERIKKIIPNNPNHDK